MFPRTSKLPALLTAAVIVVIPALQSCGAAETPPKSDSEPVYTVDKYDPKRDPAKDLAEAAKKAKTEGRRILVQVGGDWCGWCRTLTKFFHQNDAVSRLLATNYVIMKVNYSGANENDAFLEKYPEVYSFPHLFVLDENGKLLHSQDMEEFEKGGGYNEKAITGFLTKWAPEKKS